MMVGMVVGRAQVIPAEQKTEWLILKAWSFFPNSFSYGVFAKKSSFGQVPGRLSRTTGSGKVPGQVPGLLGITPGLICSIGDSVGMIGSTPCHPGCLNLHLPSLHPGG